MSDLFKLHDDGFVHVQNRQDLDRETIDEKAQNPGAEQFMGADVLAAPLFSKEDNMEVHACRPSVVASESYRKDDGTTDSFQFPPLRLAEIPKKGNGILSILPEGRCCQAYTLTATIRMSKFNMSIPFLSLWI